MYNHDFFASRKWTGKCAFSPVRWTWRRSKNDQKSSIVLNIKRVINFVYFILQIQSTQNSLSTPGQLTPFLQSAECSFLSQALLHGALIVCLQVCQSSVVHHEGRGLKVWFFPPLKTGIDNHWLRGCANPCLEEIRPVEVLRLQKWMKKFAFLSPHVRHPGAAFLEQGAIWNLYPSQNIYIKCWNRKILALGMPFGGKQVLEFLVRVLSYYPSEYPRDYE